MKEKLTAKLVSTIFMDCLFTDKEMAPGTDVTSKAIMAEGVTTDVGFHPDRLNDWKPRIVDLLDQIPENFHEDTGGGWSFLNACVDRNGDQWGEQMHVQELLLLGLAIGRIKYCLPKQYWSTLPGGVPYFMVVKGEKV